MGDAKEVTRVVVRLDVPAAQCAPSADLARPRARRRHARVTRTMRVAKAAIVVALLTFGSLLVALYQVCIIRSGACSGSTSTWQDEFLTAQSGSSSASTESKNAAIGIAIVSQPEDGPGHRLDRAAGHEVWGRCNCEGGAKPLRSAKSAACVSAEDDRRASLEEADRTFQRNMWRRERWLWKIPHGERQLAIESRYLEFYAAPSYPCYGERRLGPWKKGGQWICDTGREQNRRDNGSHPIAYSIGSNADLTLANDFFMTYGAKFYVFVPPAVDLGELSPWVVVHGAGPAPPKRKPVASLLNRLFGAEAAETLSPPATPSSEPMALPRLATVTEVQRRLRHERVDYLTLECNGYDAAAVEEMLVADGRTDEMATPEVVVGQVQLNMENIIHERPIAMAFFGTMEKLGYRIFHLDKNRACETCLEVSYIHESLLRL